MSATTAAKVLNDAEQVAHEMIEGFVAANPGVVRLDGFPDIKVIRRKELNAAHVSVICGGGSGHEPAFGGFVGDGMLSAAVCGGVFASPSVDEVLAAIRSVTGPAGCLLCLMNYTGDRLNFGLAAERAKLEGYNVEMVIVGEDCALPPPRGLAGRRGLAGTLLCLKVAGAAAAAGLPLAAVLAETIAAAQAVGTMGVALTSCTLPGCAPSMRIPPGEMELGLGIHGEPGAFKGPLRPADEVVKSILDTIMSTESGYLPLQSGEPVALLVNSLGATPPMELSVITHSALRYLKALERAPNVARVYTGMFMTSLDMVGFSLTLMRLPADRAARLDAPHSAPAWPALPQVYDATKAPLPMVNVASHDVVSAEPPTTPMGITLQRAIKAAAETLIAMEDKLTQWDVAVGDGDCGITTTRGAKGMLQDAAAKYPLDDPSATALQLGLTVRRSMGGTSGALYDIFFHAVAAQLKQHPPSPTDGAVAAKAWSAAFEAGVGAIKAYGGASLGDRTMLDALLPATTTLSAQLDGGASASDALTAAVAAAQAGADATCTMAAGAGRSSYVPEEVLKDNPDPGAQAAAGWLRAVLNSLTQ